MEFNIKDIVVLNGDITRPHVIVDKGRFFSEISPNNEKILYKLSCNKEIWYSGECLENYYEHGFNIESIQKECHLCQKYGEPSIVSGYCMGFADYMEPTTIIEDRYCGVCGACIENR